MDEKYIEMAGALAEGEVSSGRAVCAKGAIPDKDLEPEQYKRLDCEVCEEPLPLFRLKKGLTICVECKNLAERARKR